MIPLRTSVDSRSFIRRTPGRLIRSRSWQAITTLLPACTSVGISPITASRAAPSRLAVGSSSSNSLGRSTRARASATRCFSPPDSVAGGLSRRWPMPAQAMASSTLLRISSRDRPRPLRPEAMLSATLVENITGCWCT
jgi:hypothetical protein